MLTAPVNWQDLAWALEGASAELRMQVEFASGELPCADAKVLGRERFRVEASVRGASRGCRVVVHDDDEQVNGTLIRNVAILLSSGGRLERAPCPDGEVTLTDLDGTSLSVRLLSEPTLVDALLERLGVRTREGRIQCGVQSLAARELQVLPGAQHLVVEF